MYAQKLEGDSWIGEKMDTAKIDKMSGLFIFPYVGCPTCRCENCLYGEALLI